MNDDMIARLECAAEVYESTDSPTDAYVARTFRDAKAEIERLRKDNTRLKDRVERLRITLEDVGRQATGALKLISAKGADR